MVVLLLAMTHGNDNEAGEAWDREQQAKTFLARYYLSAIYIPSFDKMFNTLYHSARLCDSCVRVVKS